jgi:hypothetical protein
MARIVASRRPDHNGAGDRGAPLGPVAAPSGQVFTNGSAVGVTFSLDSAAVVG